jgi:hypothetical protein
MWFESADFEHKGGIEDEQMERHVRWQWRVEGL